MVHRFGPFELDPASGRLFRGPRRVPLSDTQAAILVQLVSNVGEVVSREGAHRGGWGNTEDVGNAPTASSHSYPIRDIVVDSAVMRTSSHEHSRMRTASSRTDFGRGVFRVCKDGWPRRHAV